MIAGREKWGTADVSKRSFRNQAGRNRARVFHSRIALMIEEPYGEAGIERNLIGIRFRPSDLVQAESGHQVGFVGNTMIDADRKLIGIGVDLGGRFISTSAISSRRVVGQGVASKYGGNRGADGGGRDH